MPDINEAISVDADVKGWITCPNCGFKFSFSDARVFQRGCHQRCGQRIDVQTTSAMPLTINALPWTVLWEERIKAIEPFLGPADNTVLHSMIPLEFVPELGSADVITFRRKLDGIAYVTANLIGNYNQIENSLGNYELMICHRQESDWGPDLVSRLAHYTCQQRIDPGHTMALGPPFTDGSTIKALLFAEFARFQLAQKQCGLLLCIGITVGELAECKERQAAFVQKRLDFEGVFPFTDLERTSLF